MELITREEGEKVAAKIMSGNYEPTSIDAQAIYSHIERRSRRKTLARALSDVYDWLAQGPLCIECYEGRLCARFEIDQSAELDGEDIFYLHYCYINFSRDIIFEGWSGEENITEWTLKEFVMGDLKDYIREYVKARVREETYGADALHIVGKDKILKDAFDDDKPRVVRRRRH